MMKTDQEKKRWYGWWILPIITVCYFLLVGAVFYGYAVMSPVMMQAYGVDRPTISMTFSIYSLMGLLTLVGGDFVVRYGARRMMTIGFTATTIGCIITALSPNVYWFWIGYGVLVPLGATVIGAFFVGPMVLSSWFFVRRGLAIGIMVAAGGLGAAVFSRWVLPGMMSAWGWRSAWWLLAGLTFVFCLIPVALFLRNKPEDIGQAMDGVVAVPPSPPKKRRWEVYKSSVDWKRAQAVQTTAMWFMGMCEWASAWALAFMLSQVPLRVHIDLGESIVTVGIVMFIYALVGIVGRMGSGFLADHFPGNLVLGLSMAISLIGVVSLYLAPSMALIYVFAACFGYGYGAIKALLPTLVGNYYGRRYFPTIYSLVLAPGTILMFICPYFSAWMYELTGTYAIPLTISIVLVAAATILAFLIRAPKLCVG